MVARGRKMRSVGTVTRIREQRFRSVKALDARSIGRYAFDFVVVCCGYLLLAKLGWSLAAAVQPSAPPIWPASGVGLAAVLVRGLRIWPAILVPAWIAGAQFGAAGGVFTCGALAAGSALEALLGGYLINLWSGGRRTFDTATGVAKFTLISFGCSTVGGIVGSGSLDLTGHADWPAFVASWAGWWLCNAAGALVVAPAIVLWTNSVRTFSPKAWLGKPWSKNVMLSAGALLAAAAVGVVAFSPLFPQASNHIALSFFALLPLMWTALRCGTRDTATIVPVLSGFAVWGAVAGVGPFAGAAVNGSFLPLIAFMVSASAAGLALSADAAARIDAESKLQRWAADLGALFRQAVVGLAQLDTVGRFKVVNERYCEIFRRSAAELTQVRIQDLVAAEERDRVLHLIERAASTGEGFALEAKHLLPDGSHAWARVHVSAIGNEAGNVRYLTAIAEDVSARHRSEDLLQRAHNDVLEAVQERTNTLEKIQAALNSEIEERKRVEAALKQDIAERRKAQHALIESERRFRTVIQGISDYAIFTLDRDGRVKNWNSGAQRIYQFTAAEAVGEHFGRFYTEEEQQHGEPARALQAASYEGKWVGEGWRVRRDESRFWASVAIEAVRDEVGGLTGFVNITRDITDRREAQASLERAQEQLAQSQKMEALGQLTGSIAHDFNNLLMIVSGHAQLLRRRIADPKHLQAIDAIHSAANRGESLTRQLLAFSRRQPINPVPIELKEQIQSTYEMLLGSLRGNVELKCEIPPDIWPVEVDIAEFELALVNIAVNARDAMPGGGSITLSARNVSLKKTDGVDRLEGDFVALSMTDTGVGIAPDVLPRIFEPFFTTKALGKGTGLGLAQVYGFSQQSGGSVVATSRVGSGTAITMYLPRAAAVQANAVESAPAPAPASAVIDPVHGTILVVEDNPEVAAVTASLVEQLGYRTVGANNATDALARLQRGDDIELVLSDVVMPGGMNGFALAQEIANHYPHIPVLLTSGYNDVVQTAGSHVPILRKPFQLPILDKSIREALQSVTTRNGRDRVVRFVPRGAGKRE
jgi:PAS domain S-box-containing protein